MATQTIVQLSFDFSALLELLEPLLEELLAFPPLPDPPSPSGQLQYAAKIGAIQKTTNITDNNTFFIINPFRLAYRTTLSRITRAP